MKELLITPQYMVDFTSKVDISSTPPKYDVYIEFIALTHKVSKGFNLALVDWNKFSEVFDLSLQSYNSKLETMRKVSRIAPPRLLLLKNGAFESLKREICGFGSSHDHVPTAPAQYNTPRLLTKPSLVTLIDSFVLDISGLVLPTISELEDEVNRSAVQLAMSSEMSLGEVSDALTNTLKKGIKDAEKLVGHPLSYAEMRGLFG
jgi:hypothetical protein